MALEPRTDGVPRTVRSSQPAFQPGDVPGWKEIHRLTPAQVYPAGIALFPQGTQPQDVFFLDSGLVKLVRLDRDGRELILGLCFPDGLIGTASVIAQALSPVSAVTSTRCHLHRIPAEVFLHVVRTDPRLSWQLHQRHSHELHAQTMRLAQLSGLSSRSRLEHILRELIFQLHMNMNESQKEIRLQLPLKHWEIAGLIAVTPEHLSRLLTQMQRDGVIRREKGWVIVPDLLKLPSHADHLARCDSLAS